MQHVPRASIDAEECERRGLMGWVDGGLRKKRRKRQPGDDVSSACGGFWKHGPPAAVP